MPHGALPGARQTSRDDLSPYSRQLSALELASGQVWGEDAATPPLPDADPSLAPVDALGETMIPYLERPPCLVSFSGGRDSSVVLAVATAVARREGLELPIPISQQYPDAPDANERRWQELVVRHVRLPDWLRHEVRDELDLVGPLATRFLAKHGVLWPGNAHSMFPLLCEARGGTLLTGFDGDSLFRTWRWERAASVLRGRVRPGPRDLLRVGVALAPASVRRWRLRRKEPPNVPWLRADAADVVAPVHPCAPRPRAAAMSNTPSPSPSPRPRAAPPCRCRSTVTAGSKPST